MQTAKPKIIDVKNVGKSFGERLVLRDVTMHVKHDEIVSVLGISGSGKTTLFHLIANMLLPDEGSIDTSINIGYMMQKDLLMPWKTVIENVALPLILRGEKKEEAYKKCESFLPKFGLAGTSKLYPQALSGGMRQRAALLRTYLQSGELFLLDEPFSSVDAMTRHQLHKWLLDIKAELSLSILLITHDIEEALILSDRIYILAGSPAGMVEEIDLSMFRDKKSDENYKSALKRARERIYEILDSEMN